MVEVILDEVVTDALEVQIATGGNVGDDGMSVVLQRDRTRVIVQVKWLQRFIEARAANVDRGLLVPICAGLVIPDAHE